MLARSAVAGLIWLLLAAPAALAQCTGRTRAPNPTPAQLAFPTPTRVDLDNGYIVYNSTLSLQINGSQNQTFALCVRAGTPDLGISASGGSIKPIGDLQVRLSGAGAFLPLSQVDYFLGYFNGKATVNLDVQMLVSWLDEPGSYTTQILVTAYR